MRSWKSRVVLLGLLAVGAAACGDGGDGAGDDGSVVSVAMKDWDIALDPGTTSAGPITFEVTNDGPTTHEFEIFSGDVDPSSLPVEAGVANTEGLKLVDEVEDVTSGARAELAVTLEPSMYALICNLADHYEEGMYTALTVE